MIVHSEKKILQTIFSSSFVFFQYVILAFLSDYYNFLLSESHDARKITYDGVQRIPVSMKSVSNMKVELTQICDQTIISFRN